MDTGEIKFLTTQNVINGCREQTEIFRQSGKSDERFCYELMRRAAANHRDHELWNAVDAQYRKLFLHYARQSGWGDLEIEDVVQTAFERWQKYALNPGRFSRFKSLEALIKYAKEIVHTVVKDKERIFEREQKALDLFAKGRYSEAEQSNIEKWLSDQDRRKRLLTCVLKHCKTERERQVAILSWRSGLPPREIRQVLVDQFKTTAQVSQCRKLILDRLRRDTRCLESLRDAPN